MSEQGGRSVAEWVSFAISCVVLAVVIGLISLGLVGDQDPAEPTARPSGPAVEQGDGFHVQVEVRNRGDEAAADVQVTAALVIDGEPSEGDLLVDFLAGNETRDLMFVFPDDPADGELVVRVTSYREP